MDYGMMEEQMKHKLLATYEELEWPMEFNGVPN